MGRTNRRTQVVRAILPVWTVHEMHRSLRKAVMEPEGRIACPKTATAAMSGAFVHQTTSGHQQKDLNAASWGASEPSAQIDARIKTMGLTRTFKHGLTNGDDAAPFNTFSIYLNNAMLTAFETACEEGRNNSQSMPRSNPEPAQRCAEAAGLDGGDRDRSTIRYAGTDGLPPTAMPRRQVRGSLHHVRRRGGHL